MHEHALRRDVFASFICYRRSRSVRLQPDLGVIISDALIQPSMPNYDEIFDWHIANRRHEIGVSDVADAVRQLVAGSRILDLGCGDGVPITRFLVQSGFEVFGVDSSARMTERFRLNFPDAQGQCAAYKKLLLGNQLRLVDEHFDEWENYIYIAEKPV